MEKVLLFVLGLVLLFGGAGVLNYTPNNLVENTTTVSTSISKVSNNLIDISSTMQGFWSNLNEFVKSPFKFIFEGIWNAIKRPKWWFI